MRVYVHTTHTKDDNRRTVYAFARVRHYCLCRCRVVVVDKQRAQRTRRRARAPNAQRLRAIQK